MGRLLTLGAGSGSFTPLAFSPALWLDANDPATLFQNSTLTTPATADGDPVGGWKDKSGNARHLTQATSSKRPTLKTNIQNGLPVVRGDGVDDFLRCAFTFAQPQTFFFVTRVNTFLSSAFLLGGVTDDRRIFSGGGANRKYMYAGTGLAPSLTHTDNTWGVLTAVFNGASSTIALNAGSATTGNSGTNTGGGVTLFGSDSVGQCGAMDIAELLLFGTLTADEKTQILNYLNAKWAVY